MPLVKVTVVRYANEETDVRSWQDKKPGIKRKRPKRFQSPAFAKRPGFSEILSGADMAFYF